MDRATTRVLAARLRRGRRKRPRCLAALLFRAVLLWAVLGETAGAVDVSPPAILQWFEASYGTVIDRTPDAFMAGYGAVWLPPTNRADLGNFSVGYDAYDRFDLGRWDNQTLYGTETGIQRVASVLHRAALDLHVDFVMNHNGYSGTGDAAERAAFLAAGAYPGFFLEFFGDPDGDFNSGYSYGDVQGRLAGLIDIDHAKNYLAVRNPVPGSANNMAPGTIPWNGRLANLPDENNRRFYPDVGHNTMFLYDPMTDEHDIPVHQFNLEDPMAGDPTEENALGYLMRNAQWLIQVIGADGLRIDAAKHVEGFVLDYIDRAVYRQNPRPLLDGSPQHVFTYSEVYDGDPNVLLPHVKKTIDPNQIGVIGGNRDTLDFKLYFALKDRLESGTQPDWDNWNDLRWAWYDLRNAALDHFDDGLHNGSAGVKFVHNHDVFKPYQLDGVAHAYTLLMPGSAIVYFNGKQFGDQRDFPKPGRGDALSVRSGSDLTRLLEIRNSHGRGDYAERWIDDQGLFAFERVSSAIVLLSNRSDPGFDSRTLTNVGFAPGTHLIELSGHAESAEFDPFNDFAEVVTVFEEGGVRKVNVRFPHNSAPGGGWHGSGYLVYGLPAPEAPAGLELTGVDSVLAGSDDVQNDYQNGITRQTDLHVVHGDALQVRLQTIEVNLLGNPALRDVWADGDNALLKLDGGRDLNGNGYVDFTTPDSVSYGFEPFGDKSSPLIGPNGLEDPAGRGDGEFRQTIDVAQLTEGVHFLEARAFRHRTDGGPAVFSSFKKAVYVDRLPPESAVQEFRAVGGPGDTDVLVASLDFTADSVHVFANLPADVGDAEIYEMVGQGQGTAERVDVNLFKKYFAGLATGNHVLTVATFEPTGTSNVQRIAGQWIDGRGAGLGDLNHDWALMPEDLAGVPGAFEDVLWSRNSQFNPAADVDGDGLVDNRDLFALGDVLVGGGAGQAVLDTYREVRTRRGDVTQNGTTDAADVDFLFGQFGSDDWLFDLNVDGTTDDADVDTLLEDILNTYRGDANLDGFVDAADLAVFRQHVGSSGSWLQGNFNGDAFIDAADLVWFRRNVGRVAPPSLLDGASEAVPEPHAVALLASGLMATVMLRRRRKRRR